MLQDNALGEGERIGGYRIRRVLGAGSFGVTYLAHDEALSRDVALKEYFPVDYASRGPNRRISPRNQNAQTTFEWGLERFSEEARTLARFRHPNIVHVLQLLTGINGTAYIAMELLDGRNLEEEVQHDGVPDADKFVAIFQQLLDGVEAVHKIGILHRDIKPSNVVMQNGAPVLIDFGSSRELALQRGSGFSAVVTDGYSPLEQYSRSGVQAAYTDIYALAGTAHFLLTGVVPPPSAARADGEAMAPVPAARTAQFWPQLLSGIDKALSLRAVDRPASIEAWRALCGARPVPKEEDRRFEFDRRLLLIGGGGLVAASVAGFGIWRSLGGESLSDSAAPLTVAWRKPIGPTLPGGPPYGDPDPFPDIVATPTGAVLATFQIDENGADRAVAIRFDDDGNITGTWRSTSANSRFHAIVPTPDGGAIVAGGVTKGDALIARISPDWQTTMWQYPSATGNGFGSGVITSLAIAPDGAVLGGVEDKEFGNARVIAVGPDGQKRAGNTVAIDPKNDSVQRMVALPSGGYAVLGLRFDERQLASTGDSSVSMWVVILDSALQETHRRRVLGAGAARGWAMITAGDYIYIAGTTDSGHPGAVPVLLMVCMDKNGEHGWTVSNYPGAISSGRCLALTPDNRLYVGGRSGDPNTPRLSQIGGGGSLLWDKDEAAGPGVTGTINALSMRSGNDGFATMLRQAGPATFFLDLIRLKA